MPASVTPNSAFVDLNRRFSKLHAEVGADQAAVRSYTLEGVPDFTALHWNDLLEKRRVVILGEPGSGKTREFRETAARLNREGKLAFFVRLEEMITASLEEVLGPAEAEKFKHWKASDMEVILLLDSVDEAKLGREADFYAVLGKLSSSLGSEGLSRARIILSSRITNWRADVDPQRVVEHFGLGGAVRQRIRDDGTVSEDRTAEGDLLVVTLEPFDRQEVERFVQGIGVGDAAGLLGELDRSYVWEFARRPADTADLVGLWNDQKRLGTLTELVAAAVQRNLRESPDREGTSQNLLTEGDAKLGARSLAAASVFCRRRAFRQTHSPDDSAIDGTQCLPDTWPAARYEALIARPLFDDASYGRRQFHHRRLAEYLAAQWMADRMAEGCPARELKRIFFEGTPHGLLLRPALEATAASLCGMSADWAADFRGWVLMANPEIHLSFGDPAALPIDYRRKVLRAIAARYADRQHVRLDVDFSALLRLASSELAADVAELIRDRGTVVEFRRYLLLMAELGKLTDCMGVALEIATSPEEPEGVRISAAEAIIGAGRLADRTRLAEFVATLPQVSDTFGHHLIRLYPATMGERALLGLVQKVSDDDGGIFPGMLGRYLSDTVSREPAGRLLAGFLELITRPPHLPDQGGFPVSVQFLRLAPALVPVVIALLKSDSLSDQEITDLATALLVIGKESNHLRETEADELRRLSERHPAVRRAYFWRCHDIARRQVPADREVWPWSWHPFWREPLLRPVPADLEWLIRDVGADEDTQRRCPALRMALELWKSTGRPAGVLGKLKASAADSAELRELLKLAKRPNLRDRILSWWHFEVEHKWMNPTWRSIEISRIKRFKAALWSRIWLHFHLRRIASGSDSHLLSSLVVGADSKSNDRWTVKNWSGLRKKFGRIVIAATRKGCKRTWRRYEPVVPSAKPEANKTANEIVVGLNGINAELEDGELIPQRMPEREVWLATRYAVHELNAFPPWLDLLAQANPSAVGRGLFDCILDEWTISQADQRLFGVLAKVVGRTYVFGPPVRSEVLRQLLQGDPQQDGILSLALQLVLPGAGDDLRALAASRAKADGNRPGSALWATAWLKLDPDAALAWLETLELCDPKANQVVISVLAGLHGGDLHRLVQNPDAPYMEARRLKRLILTAYRHVRIADDLHRDGSYTPVGRDYAQEFRDGLLGALAATRGGEVAGLLGELADDPALAPIRDAVLQRRDLRRRLEIEGDAWNPAAIRQFEAEHESDPRTDSDLFKIALNRLADIQDAVERSDNSIREAVDPNAEEYGLRRWLASEFARRSRQRYTQPQETEIEEAKRPDIRLENPKVDGPVSIEMKWMENYSLNELYEALETQLVGDYLRAHNSRHGIFLLATIGKNGPKKKWENPDTGAKMTFSEAVAAVRAKTREILLRNSAVRGLEVVSIDFRPVRDRD